MSLRGIEACYLWDFIAESNKIEGITTKNLNPTTQVPVYEDFLALPSLGVADMVRPVDKLEPGAELRAGNGMNVMVGCHIPPYGGPHIVDALSGLLNKANASVKEGPMDIADQAYRTHCSYEELHPFMDGNGRSGRALWAWMMRKAGYDFRLGFLHKWYYQSLDNEDGRE